MSYSDSSLLRPRSRYESKRGYFHRGYLWPWSLVLLIPFVLRFAVFYDVTFSFQPSPSTTDHERPEELQLYKLPEGSPDGVEIPIIHDSQVVHPGHGARITYDDRISNVDDRVENDPSHGRTENERSTVRHLPLPKRADEQDTVDVNLRFPENDDIIEGVVDEVQLRQIGEKIQAIKRWENWEERSRWNGEQEVVDDQLESGQGNEEKKVKELKTTEESLATEVRKAADTDDERAVEESIVAAEIEAEEDSKVVEELESSGTRTSARKQSAAKERRAANEMEVEVDGLQQVAGELEAAEERRDIEDRVAARDAEDERKLEEEVEAEEERRAAEERDAEEELMTAKEREAEKETSAAQEKEADQEWKTEERMVDELREAGGKKISEAEESAEEKRESNESRNDEEQNQAAKQTHGEKKNSSKVEEQKTTNDQEQEERTVKLEEPVEEGTVDQNHENGKEEKDEAIHEDSDQTYREDSTSPIDHTHGASLAAGECDLFDGDWEYDPEGPLYTNSTCFFIRGDHNCMSNGRPDTDYLNWRWKPRGCDLPRFDARAFMKAFTGKTIGFIGDSLARNQMQSMLCMLSLVEVPILLHDDSVNTRWFYEQHQVTVAVVWSPYLLQESQEGVMGFEKGQSVLYLDVLDPAWMSLLPDCDIIVLSVGQWYFKPSVYVMQEEVIGCHYCPNLNLTEIVFTQSYSEGLRRALERVAKDWKGIAILSTFASAHGERGAADDGDQCRRERPLDKKEWESSFRGMQNEMREIVVGEFNRMVNDKSKLNDDLHIEFLDVSTLSLLRADGHPGAYYYAHPYEGKRPDEWVFNDCLHWCLPGPVDTWNHLLVKIALKYL